MEPALPLYRQVREELVKVATILRSQGHRSFANFLELLNDLSVIDADFILYLGAGISISAEPVHLPLGHPTYRAPNWDQLLNELFERATSDDPNLREEVLRGWYKRVEIPAGPEPLTLRRLSSRVDRLELAWLIGQLYSGNDRDAVIRDIVEPHVEVHSPLLDQIIRLPTSAVITPSYDSTVRRAFKSRPVVEATPLCPTDRLKDFDNRIVMIHDEPSLSESFAKKGLRLVHMHGAAYIRGCPLILDRFDYAKLMCAKGGIIDYVTHLLRERSAIYVGFRLDDPSFNQIEQQLFIYDRIRRPKSYAFVRHATDHELQSWRERNLYLIQYPEHSQLPTLVQTLADLRAFLLWAEPKRPLEVNRQDDRTDTYLYGSLLNYSEGNYEKAVLQARAALASTTLWGDFNRVIPVDKGFDSALRLLDIRTRLGLSHYKRRYTDSLQRDRVQINIDEAESIVSDLVTSLGQMNEIDTQLENSRHLRLSIYQQCLRVLKGRLLYSDGQWVEARTAYKEVIAALSSYVNGILENTSIPLDPDCNTAYERLKAIEAYCYARCQLGRIGYQWGEGKSQHSDRLDETDDLALLGRQLVAVVSRIPATPDETVLPAQIPILRRYFRQSLTTIGYVAKWFAGRHLVGTFADVIPTQAERADTRSLERLNRAIELLRVNQIDELTISPRWLALRARYLARALCLRWFVQIRPGIGDREYLEDFQQAQFFLAECDNIVRRGDLHRDYILTRIEAARIEAIALYGRIISDGSVRSLEAAWSITRAMRELSLARKELASTLADRDALFIRSIALRLLTYLKLLDEQLDVGLAQPELFPAVVTDPNCFADELRVCYDALDPIRFETRSTEFLQAFASVQDEIVNLRRSKVAA